ncbi:hypothetical protein C8Q77DRAFT_1154080 [Trametes polyzona]|nr:hypothetical protein C8Q77DRAFT_1154080 [Trametes polyzona]
MIKSLPADYVVPLSVRFSPDGRHLIAGTSQGLLYFAWDFARTEQGALFLDISEYLWLDNGILSILWEPEQPSRITVQTIYSEYGATIITLLPAFHRGIPDTNYGSSPTLADGVVAYRPVYFIDEDKSTCEPPMVPICMTRTTLWLIWSYEHLQYAIAKREAHEASSSRGTTATSPVLARPAEFLNDSICFIDFAPGM